MQFSPRRFRASTVPLAPGGPWGARPPVFKDLSGSAIRKLATTAPRLARADRPTIDEAKRAEIDRSTSWERLSLF